MARIAGVCYVKVDGEQLEIQSSCEYPLSKTKKEAVEGVNGPVGYKETRITPFLNIDCTLTPEFPRQKLVESDDLTIVAELANGTVYTLTGAYVEGDITGNAIDGTTSITFKGKDCNWS